jgi:hypothetical protein
MKLSPALLAACILVLSGCEQPDPGPRDASYVARRLQFMVGHRQGPVTVTSVEADANVLVVLLEGPRGFRLGNPSFRITAGFLHGFCQVPEAEGYFRDQRRLRVDTREAGGRRIQGSPVSRCPDGMPRPAKPTR